MLKFDLILHVISWVRTNVHNDFGHGPKCLNYSGSLAIQLKKSRIY